MLFFDKIISLLRLYSTKLHCDNTPNHKRFRVCITYPLKQEGPSLEMYKDHIWSLVLCHSRKHLNRFIKMEKGRCFEQIVVREFRVQTVQQINIRALCILQRIMFTEREYFECKINKYPLKEGYIVLKSFIVFGSDLFRHKMSMYGKVQRIRPAEIISQFRLDNKASICCNNAKCKVTGGDMKLLRCKQCRVTFYCSKKCQKYDWNVYGHKSLCSSFIK